MTCGACCPESFRPPSNGRVFGYTVARTPSQVAYETRNLLFLGAQHVFADHPMGRVIDREGYTRLRKVMREGDRLIASSLSCFGTKRDRAEANIADIEAGGVTVAVVRPEYFSENEHATE